MTRHLDAGTIYALLDGELDPVDEGRAEAHLMRCPECRARREECGAVLTSLRWYAAEPPPPPAGYWDDFWRRFPCRVEEGVGPAAEAPPRRPRRRAAPLATAAAAAVLLAGAWWATLPGEDPAPPLTTAPARTVVADTGWESDVEFFERATVAVGSVDPLSKGVALVALAESQ